MYDKIVQLKLPASDENNKKSINRSKEKLVDILICELVKKCHELKLLATIENKKIRNFRIFFNRETSINSLIP